VRRDTLCVFDINLRQAFYSKGVVENSLEYTNVLKLNSDEINNVMDLLGLRQDIPLEDKCRMLLKIYRLNLVCVTLGGRGSILVSLKEMVKTKGYTVKVEDTVGAGDAFTAALTHHLLKNTPLKEANERCNRYGAWVASKKGGTPKADRNVVEAVS